MKRKIPYLILAAGAALRLAGLVVSPFWYDESFSVYLARVPALFVHLEYIDFNPPLWEFFVIPSIWIFGENELGLRLPALFFSLGGMLLAWKLADELLPDPYKIPSAVLIAMFPYHFWLAQDGRCYAMMSLIYMAALYMAYKRRWMGFGACLGLLLYSHLVGVFYAAAAVLGALVLNRSDWRKIITWSTVAGVAYLPWVPAYLIRREAHWVGSLTVDGLLNSLYFASFAGVINNVDLARLAGLLFAGSILSGLVVSLIHWRDRIRSTLAIWAAAPLLLMIVAAAVKNVIFYRPLSAILLPMCIWIPWCIYPQKRAWRWLVGGAWCLVLFAGVIAWSPARKGAELRTMAEMINERWRPGDIVYHATGTSYLPMSLYLDHPGYVLNEEQPDGLLQTEIQQAFKIPRQALEEIPHGRAWIVYARDVLLTDRADARMAEYIQEADLVGEIHYWQAADIEIYLEGQ